MKSAAPIRIHLAVFWLVLNALLLKQSPAFAILDENLPLGHWAYPIIDELLLRGYGSTLLYGNRPYTRGEVAKLVMEVEEVAVKATGERSRILRDWTGMLREELAHEIDELGGRTEEGFLRVHVEVGVDVTGSKTEKDIELEPAFMKIRGKDEGDPHLRAVFPLGYALSFGKHFTVSEIAWIDTEMRNDPTARVKTDPKRPLRFRSAYLKYSRPHFEFQLGRERFRWGPGYTGGLVLGDSSPSFDAAMLKLRAKWFTLTSIFSQLNDEIPKSGEAGEEFRDSDIVNRFLYAHRLDMKFLPWLEFGLSETAVVTGIGRGFDLRFANPLLSIYATQQEGDREQREVNLTHSLHWFIARFPRLAIYGELFIDELIIKKRPEGAPPRPNNIGFLQGVAVTDPFDMYGLTLRGEYVRLNSFTYVHRGLNTDYEHFGSPIGHVLGPDTDQTSLFVSKAVNRNLNLQGGFAYRRRGEIRLDTEEASLGKTSSFLQGVVERRRIYSLSLSYLPRRDLFLKLDTSYIRISSMEHLRGKSEGLLDLTILISYRMHWF
ncbi:MAG: capsule assembly Wzi family protein [Candidatus Glassbacteria bacterium]